MTNLTDTDQTIDVTEFKTLLIALAELAPEVCLYESENGVYQRFILHGSYEISFMGEEYTTFPALRWRDYAALQWVLQGAIVLRGWELCLERDRDPGVEKNWSVLIWCGKLPGFESRSTNPAIALLTAFIAALQSEVTT